MKKIFLDIETIPTQDNDLKSFVLETNRKKVKPSSEDKAYRDTALDGAFGEILSIGWAVDDEPAKVLYRSNLTPAAERGLLLKFYSLLKPALNHHTIDIDDLEQKEINYEPSLWVGHNIRDFDLRFIYQRTLVHQINPEINLCMSYEDRTNVFDTQTAFAGYKQNISLAKLCKALGIKCKSGGIEGAKVWDAVLEGRFEDIALYCKEDVEATREAFYKLKQIRKSMNFGMDEVDMSSITLIESSNGSAIYNNNNDIIPF